MECHFISVQIKYMVDKLAQLHRVLVFIVSYRCSFATRFGNSVRYEYNLSPSYISSVRVDDSGVVRHASRLCGQFL